MGALSLVLLAAVIGFLPILSMPVITDDYINLRQISGAARLRHHWGVSRTPVGDRGSFVPRDLRPSGPSGKYGTRWQCRVMPST